MLSKPPAVIQTCLCVTSQVHVAGAGFVWDGTRVQPRALRPVQRSQDTLGEVESQPAAVQHHVP